MKKNCLLLGILVLFATMANATVHYVSPLGNNSTGTSWGTAYTSIQQALSASINGDEIWVAQGEYVIENKASQLVIKSGVNVYGGFLGSETNRTARNINPALTVIRHKDVVTENFRLLTCTDLDDSTIWDGFTFDGKGVGSGIALAGNSTMNNSIIKNCFLLNATGAAVYMSSGSSFIPVVLSNSDVVSNKLQVSSDNTFQLGGAGVFISKGAKMSEILKCNIMHNKIEGISATGTLEAMGAAVYLYEGTIRNCEIDDNHVLNTANPDYSHNNFTAGGIAIVPDKTDVEAKSVLIEGCKITNSTSNSRGGAIIIDPRWSGQYHGNYTISKTIIANNQSKGPGAGILLTAATKQTGNGWTLNIENSLITNNGVIKGSGNAGGGMYVNIGCVLNMTNTTIVRNYSDNYGGAGIFMQGTGNHTIKATFKNTLLWGNVAAGGRPIDQWQINNGTQASTIVFSAIQQYDATAASLVGATLGDNIALGVNNNDIDGPGFVSPSSDAGYGVADALTANWKLSSSSILIDAGDDYLPDDLIGTSRPKGDYSDIGAYEYDPTSSLPDNRFDNIRIYAHDGHIIIDNTFGAQQIKVYSILGSMVKSQQLIDGLNYVQLPQNHCYLVKIDNIVKKIFVK